ncbi:MAG TPA: prolyl oligopeptidase family serine peptidase, partial [Candidatus Cybelea sp.]
MLIAAYALAAILSYSFPSEPVRDARGDAIAYTLDTKGIRTIWFAHAPDWAAKQLFTSQADDGQELSDLAISSDGAHVVYVRGGDHDANWELPLQPGPAALPQEPEMEVYSIATRPSTSLRVNSPRLLGEGDAPAISRDGRRVAFIRSDALMVAPIDGGAGLKRLFFDRGQDSEPRWSPDGSALAFVSTRKDHSFVGVYRNASAPLEFIAPATSQDSMPRWSPDGKQIAFVRIEGDGGPPRNPLDWNPIPWEIWVGDAGNGKAHVVWSSSNTLRGSLPQSAGGPLLEWIGRSELLFTSEEQNWPHLYAVDASRGRSAKARLLTPGDFMIEGVSVAPGRDSVVYAANAGTTPGDDDRRHLFRVDTNGTNVQLTRGASSEFGPVALANGAVAFNRATAQQPPLVTLLSNGAQRELTTPPDGFPASQLVTPQSVTFHAPDGTLIHGQLFAPESGGKHPGIVFVHGGPPRQMLLTWHYMDYYSNSYAVNQVLASRGFVVLSVNYRLGIGYGHDFNFPPRWGPTGASEYQDVVAGARFLQNDASVDAKRIGIWGGSYGGYLTALALARNSDIF